MTTWAPNREQTVLGGIFVFFFKQIFKMSYYYIPQTSTDMAVLHLPDEKIHLLKAAFKRAAVLKDISRWSPWETAKPCIYLNYLSNMTE